MRVNCNEFRWESVPRTVALGKGQHESRMADAPKCALMCRDLTKMDEKPAVRNCCAAATTEADRFRSGVSPVRLHGRRRTITYENVHKMPCSAAKIQRIDENRLSGLLRGTRYHRENRPPTAYSGFPGFAQPILRLCQSKTQAKPFVAGWNGNLASGPECATGAGSRLRLSRILAESRPDSGECVRSFLQF